MSILGKVLIFLNLVAAGAFTYLTIQDWKLRQDLQWARFRGDMLQEGLPVEAAANPPLSLDEGYVAFNRKASNGVQYQSIPKTRLADICPPGGDLLGGESVASQTAEVERLRAKFFDPATPLIPAPGANNRLQVLQGYLLNLARTGAERDGAKALLDVFDATKRETAQRDLAFLARTSSQVEAYRTMIDVLALGDPQALPDEATRAAAIAKARESVGRFAIGEAAHGGGDAAEAERQMRNLLANPNDEATKGRVKAAGPALDPVIEVAANPLTTRAQVDAAANSLAAYAEGKARPGVPAEATALKALTLLMRQPSSVAITAAQVDAAASALLEAHFQDAAAPMKDGESYAGKARKIAHLLYHIDAHRHLQANQAPDRQAWHQRVAWVVGLPMYVQVAEAQASEYAESAQRLIALITDEETAFKDQYNELVQRIRVLHSRWETLRAEEVAQKGITAENTRLMEERKTERDKLLVELKESQTRAKDTLDKLQDTQGRLFTIQRDLRNAQEAILNLEKELRRRELGVE